MDYYEILRVHPSVSVEEIKEAYRRLAHKHHPDMGGDAEKFKAIHEAYSVLSDPEKRKNYDAGLVASNDSEGSFQTEVRRALYKFQNGDVVGAESLLEEIALSCNDPDAWAYLGTVKFSRLISGQVGVEQVLDCFKRAAEINLTGREEYQRNFCELAAGYIQAIRQQDADAERKIHALNRGAFAGAILGGIALGLGGRSRKNTGRALGSAGATLGGYKVAKNLSDKSSLKHARQHYANLAHALTSAVKVFCEGNPGVYKVFQERGYDL